MRPISQIYTTIPKNCMIHILFKHIKNINQSLSYSERKETSQVSRPGQDEGNKDRKDEEPATPGFLQEQSEHWSMDVSWKSMY